MMLCEAPRRLAARDARSCDPIAVRAACGVVSSPTRLTLRIHSIGTDALTRRWWRTDASVRLCLSLSFVDVTVGARWEIGPARHAVRADALTRQHDREREQKVHPVLYSTVVLVFYHARVVPPRRLPSAAPRLNQGARDRPLMAARELPRP